MKKIIFSCIVLLGMNVMATAQVNPHAIGVRGGTGNFGYGGELSYQHGFGSSNRLELDLGMRGFGKSYGHTALTGIYHWVWNIEGGFNWYVGPGAQLGFYNDNGNSSNLGMTLGLGGQLGAEFDFNELGAPLLLGLDVRPMWGFVGGTSGIGYGGAFSLRYTF